MSYKNNCLEIYASFDYSTFNFLKVEKERVIEIVEYDSNCEIIRIIDNTQEMQEYNMSEGDFKIKDLLFKTPFAYCNYHIVYTPFFYEAKPQFIDDVTIIQHVFNYVNVVKSDNLMLIHK